MSKIETGDRVRIVTCDDHEHSGQVGTVTLTSGGDPWRVKWQDGDCGVPTRVERV